MRIMVALRGPFLCTCHRLELVLSQAAEFGQSVHRFGGRGLITFRRVNGIRQRGSSAGIGAGEAVCTDGRAIEARLLPSGFQPRQVLVFVPGTGVPIS